MLDAAADIRPKDQVAPESIAQEVKKAAAASLNSFVRATRLLILAYFVMTCITAVLDVVCFFIGVSWNTNDTEWWSYGVANIFVLSSVYITCDGLYVVWALSQMVKLPSPTGLNTLLALIGFPSGLAKMLEQEQEATKPANVEMPPQQPETARNLLHTDNKHK